MVLLSATACTTKSRAFRSNSFVYVDIIVDIYFK